MTRKKRSRRDEREALKLNPRNSTNMKPLVAAHDYRGQQQAKVGKTPNNESIESQVSKAFPHLKRFFPDLKKHKLVTEFRRHAVSGDTQWDDPMEQGLINELKRKIEKACFALGYSIHEGVSMGLLHANANEAMQQRVMLTHTSVIMVTGNLRMLIHRTAKLLALTVPFKVINENQFKLSESLAEAACLANADSQLRLDWCNLFIDYAANPGEPFGGDAVIVTGKERQTIWEDISEAMNLFVIGHEYAHHILEHSLSGSASSSGVDSDKSFKMEHEADILGLMISMRAGHDGDIANTLATFGVGAAAVLTVIEYCRHAFQVLEHGKITVESRSTHPPLVDRLECLAQIVPEILKPYGPDQSVVVRSMHGMFVGIIQNAWNSAEEKLIAAHSRGIRPISLEDSGWLPGRRISEAFSRK